MKVMPGQSKYLADDHCVMVCWDQRMAGKSYNGKESCGIGRAFFLYGNEKKMYNMGVHR